MDPVEPQRCRDVHEMVMKNASDDFGGSAVVKMRSMYAYMEQNVHQIHLIIKSFFINEMKMKGTEINIYENITFSGLNRIGKKYVVFVFCDDATYRIYVGRPSCRLNAIDTLSIYTL